MLKKLLIGILLSASLFSQFSLADTPPSKEIQQQRLTQWKQLSPEKRKAILKGFKQYKKLPAPEKEVLQQNFQEWQKLTPVERANTHKMIIQRKQLPLKQKQFIIEKKQSHIARKAELKSIKKNTILLREAKQLEQPQKKLNEKAIKVTPKVLREKSLRTRPERKLRRRI